MISSTLRGGGRKLALLAVGAGLAAASSAAAQISNLPPGAVVQPLPDRDSGAELRRHLLTLAQNPRSVSALIGAGRAALEMGDAQAALGFFARADEAAPRDARVKAGMGSALVRLEQGEAALGYFAEAAALGAPEIEIAADRGLAYDIAGNPRGAQRDYALVLRSRDDPEVRQRLALSLAISGERDAALNLIDPEVRRHDRAAWRTRAFVLALTGDAAGAHQAARVTMPVHAAEAMAPFLARLSALDPAQKAAAVHFGRFPADGRPSQMASSGAPGADPGAMAIAEGRAIQAGTAGLRPRNPEPEPASREPRRRPGAAEQRPSQAEPGRAGRQQPAPSVRTAQAQPPVQPPAEATAAEPENEPGFDEIAALVSTLPVEQRSSPPPPPPKQAEQRPPARREAPPRAAQAAHPSRHWVQIAGGSDKTALPREFNRLKAMAPDLLKGRTPYTTPLRFTNRLLVGPFDSDKEAQEFVNGLAGKEVAAFAWTSPAGQEIEKLAARR